MPKTTIRVGCSIAVFLLTSTAHLAVGAPTPQDEPPRIPDLKRIILEVPLETRRRHLGRAVTGLALDSDGKRLHGLEVELVLDAHDRVPTRVRAATDAQGRFTLPRIPPGTHTVRAADAESTVVPATVFVPAWSDPQPVLLAEWREGTFLVLALDPHGAPVADVQVAHMDEARAMKYDKTDADGLVAFRSGTPSYLVRAIPGPGDLGKAETRVRGEGSSCALLVLPRMVALEGRVLGPDARPFTHGKVAFRTAFARDVTATIDGQGAFRVRVPQDAVGSLQLAQPREAVEPWFGELSDLAGPRKDLVLQVAPVRNDGELRVRVTTPDGKAIEGAEVRLANDAQRRGPKGVTDDKGWVRFDDLAVRRTQVSVRLPRHHPGRTRWTFDEPRSVVPGEEPLEVRAVPLARVEGRLLLPDGTPVRGSLITWKDRLSGMHESKTDVDGAFSFRVPGTPGTIGTILAFGENDGRKLRVEAAFRIPEVVRLDLVLRPADD